MYEDSRGSLCFVNRQERSAYRQGFHVGFSGLQDRTEYAGLYPAAYALGVHRGGRAWQQIEDRRAEDLRTHRDHTEGSPMR